jgi:hypothetical protein
MRALPFTLTLVATVALTLPLAAQGRVRIEGWVVDERSGDPVPAADIAIRAINDRFLASAVTDEDGRFEVMVDRQDGVTIYAGRIGYVDNRTPVLRFEDHNFFEVEIRLDPSAVLLAPLEVLARRKNPRSSVFTNFDNRVRTGNGYYITRADIERRAPNLITDILATVPGVRLESSGAGTRRHIRMARSASRECPVQIFVDGLLVTRRITPAFGAPTAGFAVDDVVSPRSVEGIEVYRGLSTVPPEFLTPDAECGVVAIWTRRGG